MRYILKPIAQQLYEIVDTRFGEHCLARIVVPGATHELSKVLEELNRLNKSNERLIDLVHGSIDQLSLHN